MPPRQSCRPDRHALSPNRGQAGRPVCRVGMSPLLQTKEAHPPPLARPRTPVKWLAFHGKPFQRRSPEIGRDVASAQVRESASLDTRPITAVNTPPRETQILPRRPRSGLLPQSRGRDLLAEDHCSKTRAPCSSPHEEPRKECSRISPLHTLQMQRCRHAASAALRRLPSSLPPQQRGARHSRSYSETSITASQQTGCPCTFCSGQPVCWSAHRRTSCPRRPAPAYRPPKGKHAVRADASSQAAGHPLSLPACRVAAACRLRRSCLRHRGPVALPRSGWPVRRSRHPAAATVASPQTPPPTTPRHFAVAFRGYTATYARKTPCQNLQSI